MGEPQLPRAVGMRRGAEVWRNETPPLGQAESEALCARLLSELGSYWQQLFDDASSAGAEAAQAVGTKGRAGPDAGVERWCQVGERS